VWEGTPSPEPEEAADAALDASLIQEAKKAQDEALKKAEDAKKAEAEARERVKAHMAARQKTHTRTHTLRSLPRT